MRARVVTFIFRFVPNNNNRSMTELEYTLNEKDLLAFNEHQLQDAEHVQRALRRNQAIVPGIIVVIALFYWFYYQDVFSAMYIALIGVAWGLLVPVYIRWNLMSQIKAKYSDEEKERILGDYTLRIQPNHLVEISNNEEVKIAWADIMRLETTKNYAFIYLDVDSAIIIPRKGVTNGDIHEFVAEADERIEAS
jgi:YcxB-like protein